MPATLAPVSRHLNAIGTATRVLLARERRLTAREWEIVHLIARGFTNREIASELVIAASTAERHVANILKKLRVRSRLEVVNWAVKHEQVEPTDSSRGSHRLPGSSSDSHVVTVPTQVTPLVGREQERAHIAELLGSRRARLLTLTGTGGTGKTRLALQATDDLSGDFRDGIYFVALAPIGDPGLVPAAIAQAVGVPDTGGTLPDTLVDFLHDRQVLLVLDNFEHVLAAAAFIPRLLAESPGSAVLVTSREVLHLSGEQCLAIPPLRVPPRTLVPRTDQLIDYEALRLFFERAHAVRPDFEITADNAPAVAEICMQLDGLPLAIELAAARVRHVPPEALLPRLANRLSVAVGGAQDLPRRQQTLRGAIGWSHDLLAPSERTLFRRMAVFAGGCTLEAAEAVCLTADIVDASAVGANESIAFLDCLASLIDKNLLRLQPGVVSGDPRYVMLETIREFGLEQLAAAGEEDAVRTRHATYFDAFVHRAEPHFYAADQLTWLARMDDEVDNLRLALQWIFDQGQRKRGQFLAGSLGYFWSIHGGVTEGRDWLSRFLGGPAGKATPLRARAKALLALGLCLERQYDLRAAHQAFNKSLSAARRAGDGWVQALTLVRTAWTAERLADWSIAPASDSLNAMLDAVLYASRHYEESLAVAQRLEDDWALAMCLSSYALFLVYRDSGRARTLALEAGDIARRLGDRSLQALTLNVLGMVARNEGKSEQAMQLLKGSLELYGELNDLFSESSDLGLLAALEVEDGWFEGAIPYLERDAANYRLLGNRFMAAHALHDLAIASRRAGDMERALGAYDESIGLFEYLGQHAEVAAVRAGLGHLHLQRHELSLAGVTFGESLRVLSAHATDLGVATVLAGLGVIALDDGRPKDAACLLGAAEALVDRLQTGPILIHGGPRGYQFGRDARHTQELRTRGREAFEEMGAREFSSAVAWGRELSTEEAVALALVQADEVAHHALFVSEGR
jgi:predicted ATPase/DNA-binding CsgD family transcriptional regulator